MLYQEKNNYLEFSKGAPGFLFLILPLNVGRVLSIFVVQTNVLANLLSAGRT